MINDKKVVVVLPAYNAEKTIEKTYREIPHDIVDEILLVDDSSDDKTVLIAQELKIPFFVHEKNLGYGGNQKTCYQQALKRGADIIVMLHPDYQYPPQLVTPMAALIATGMFDVVLGSRILGGNALKGGMPFYKYISNRILTFLENLLTNQKLSEYHTGYRAFSREVLIQLPLLENSDDFIFDNQILLQSFHAGFRVGEITSPCLYNEESSSINFIRSLKYGLQVLGCSLQYFLMKNFKWSFRIFDFSKGRKII